MITSAAAQPFRILTDTRGSLNRYTSKTIDVSATASGVTAHVATEKGMINPLTVMTGGALPIPQTLYSRTKEHDVSASSGPLADAVQALTELGAKHQVTGISIGDGAGTGGLFRFEDEGAYVKGAYVGGSPVTARIDRGIQDQIGAAARTVVAALQD